MKWLFALFGVAAVLCGIFVFGGKSAQAENDFMRIHVVANSNSSADQNAKYLVKDSVVEFLIPYLSEVKNKEQAQAIILQKLQQINAVANAALKNAGLKYSAVVECLSEKMPMRAYGNFVLAEGVYDSLKITLGAGHGDNWWCVVFPAVCFINSQNPQNVEYISKIWDIISSVI